MEPAQPTLDQLRVFLAVVESGGFAAAARSLRRATSVVSYTITNLEAQLGLRLFERGHARRPILTTAGRAMFADAKAVADGVDAMRAKARGIVQGLEPELHLAFDVMFPERRVVDALSAFAAEFPTVVLELEVEALGAITRSVLDRRAGVGVSGPLAVGAEGIDRIAVGQVMMVPVAAPEHPLATSSGGPGAVRRHVQLVLGDRSDYTRGRDFGVLSPRTWRLGDLGAKHMLLKAGVGWGNMPRPMIEDDLRSGRLVLLDLPDARSAGYTFDAIHRTDTQPGPAARWLIERLAAQTG